MGLGMESGGCHHITIAIKRWATSSRQHTYRRTPRRHNHNSSQPTPSSSSPEAAGKGTSSPVNNTSPHSSRPHGSKPMRTATAPRSIRQIIKSSSVGRVADVYKRAQTRRPWVTQMVCTAVIYLIGDMNAQFLFSDGGKTEKEGEVAEVEEKEEKVGKGYDPLRTLRHLSIGIVASVPSYTWFMYVHNNFNFTSKVLSVAVKVFVQQVTFTPIFNIYFFSMHSLLAGVTLSDTVERLKKAVPTSIYNSFKLWPAVSAFSFVYVGPEFRPLFFGAIAVGWQTYLSWLNQNAAKEVQAVDTVEATHLQPVIDGKTIGPGEGMKT